MAYHGQDEFGYDDEEYDVPRHRAPAHKMHEQQTPDELVGAGMEEAMREMRRIQEAQERGEVIPDSKFLGFISVPPMAAAALQGVANPLLGWVSNHVQHHSAALATKYIVPRIHNPGTQQIAVQGISLATGAAVLLAEDVAALWSGFKGYKRELGKLANEIAPVLDDIKGGHGLTSAMTVSRDDNEVIYVHRQRLGKGLSLNSTKAAIGAGGKAANVLDLLVENFTQHGREIPGFMRKAHEASSEAREASGRGSGNGFSMASAALGPVASMFKDSMERDFKRANAQPTALSLITDLAEQLRGNPEVDDFEVKGSRRQLPLRDYIAFVFKTHQEQMSKLFPDEYTPVRAALNESLGKASEEIAHAIREGKIDPLMLIRLVGERQIVKNCGRAVASEKDVASVLRHMSGKTSEYVQITPKAYFETGEFTQKDLKELIDKSEGGERQMMLAMVPETVLTAMGYSAAEVKQAVEATAEKRADMFAETLMGLGKKGEEALKNLGWDRERIALLKKAQRDIHENGADAALKYITSGTRDAGIEKAVLSSLIEADGAEHLGTIQMAGREHLGSKESLSQMAAKARREADAGEGAEVMEDEDFRPHGRSHKDRLSHSRADRDGEYGERGVY